MKRLLPYIITVNVFCMLFVLTQVVDAQIWHLDFSPNSRYIENNHKTEVQLIIFVPGLILWLSLLSFIKIVKDAFPRLRSRIRMNMATIIVIYSINFAYPKSSAQAASISIMIFGIIWVSH